MSFKDDFNLFIGAKYGIFKGVKATQGQPTISKNIKNLDYLSKTIDVTAMAWSNDDEEDILIGLSNQVVTTYDTNFKAFTLGTDARINTEKHGTSQGSICGLSRYDGALVTAVESGHIRVVRFAENECVNIFAEGSVSKMRHSKSNPCIIGTGGLENELKLWDLSTGAKTFTAKNVPPDWLQLRVKIWVTDHCFMPSSDKVAVGSKYGYVRLYDPKAQRRPVVKVDLPDKAVNCITAGDDHTLLCGLNKGNILAVDLRMGQVTDSYKGFVGAVRDVACHPTEPYIVSVGLDRFLRVHDKASKKLLLSEYMVSRMNCVLLRSNFSLKPSESAVKKEKKSNVELSYGSNSDNEEERKFDKMFNDMEEVIDGAKKKTIAQSKVKKTESSSKKRKSQTLVNPFSTKSKQLKSSVENGSSKKSQVKTKVEIPQKVEEDSDDDIMIVEEVVADPAEASANDENEAESEPDEADGDSEEFDDDDSDSSSKVTSKSSKKKNRR